MPLPTKNDNTSTTWRDVVHDYFLFETEEEPLKVTETVSLDSVEVSVVTTVDYDKEEFHVTVLTDDFSKPMLLGTYTCPIKAVWHHFMFAEVIPNAHNGFLTDHPNNFADFVQKMFPRSWNKDREHEVHEHLNKVMLGSLLGVSGVHLAQYI